MSAMERWIEAHRGWTAWVLFAGTLAALVLTLDDPGITWDESPYFGSAQLELGWVRTLLSDPSAALDREAVFEAWDADHYHNPHPPVYKEAMALTWWIAHGLLGELAGFRLAPALLFAAMIALAFRWAAAAWGGVAGIGAALSILLMPRLFGHAHLGATETPLMAFWIAASAAGWWAIEREGRNGWVLVGIAWGLAAGTKFTGLLAIVPLAGWGLWRNPRATARGVLVAAATAAVVFFALNPMMWFDPEFYVRRWISESLSRGEYAPIATYYLGRTYPFAVPWHHVFVLTIAVVPLGILALAGGGAAVGLKRRDAVAVLAVGTVVFFWLTMLVPGAPHHDGARQFIVVFPFLGMLAGYGLGRAWRQVGGRLRAGLLVLGFGPAALQLSWIHPYELAYYSEIVGGVRGANALGLETTYWMDTYTGPMLAWMNDSLPEGAAVFVSGDRLGLEFQQGWGRLRPDLVLDATRENAEWALVQMRQGLMDRWLVDLVREARPVHSVELQDVPLVAIYRIGDPSTELEGRPQ